MVINSFIFLFSLVYCSIFILVVIVEDLYAQKVLERGRYMPFKVKSFAMVLRWSTLSNINAWVCIHIGACTCVCMHMPKQHLKSGIWAWCVHSYWNAFHGDDKLAVFYNYVFLLNKSFWSDVDMQRFHKWYFWDSFLCSHFGMSYLFGFWFCIL